MADLPFQATLDAITSRLPKTLQKPVTGIICGSGLGGLVHSLRETVEIPYSVLPGFATSTTPGHKSLLAFGLVGPGEGIPVVAMLGRFHTYEGHSLSTIVYPVRVFAKLGIKNIIITNAAGSLNPNIGVGTIVVLHDHLALPNLTGLNPLFGPLVSPNDIRFLPLSDAYSRKLRLLAFRASNALSLPRSALAEGTYAWVSGPTYESPAEGRFLRQVGADVVGMSTVPEVVAAKHEGLEVLAMSLVTNAVVIPDGYASVREEVDAELAGTPIQRTTAEIVSHEEVLAAGKAKEDVLKALVQKIIETM